jgi:hypothetical protein
MLREELKKSKEDNTTRKIEQKENNRSSSKTYLIYDGCLYKIGKSINPEKRLKSIRSQNPKAEIVHIIESDIELSLHKRFKNKRVHHEWFDLSEREVSELKALN